MLQDRLRQALTGARPALSRAGVSHLAVFSSQARGQASASSDLDVLVEVRDGEKFSLLDLIGVEHTLSAATGIRVNALMRRSLDQGFKARIESDLVEIF